MRLARVLESHREIKGVLIDGCEYEVRSHERTAP
jgi:hypothetical protein